MAVISNGASATETEPSERRFTWPSLTPLLVCETERVFVCV